MNTIALRLLKKLEAELGETVYLVGGALRDILLEREVQEYDFTTPASVAKIEGALKKLSPYIDPKGKDFGTLAGEIEGARVEITQFRTEEYDLVSRKPRVKKAMTLAEDLERRDFTINSLAWDGKKIYDFFQGERDLLKKTIRFTSDPQRRILEDPLRMVRAVRFAATLGFSIHRDSWNALTSLHQELSRIAPERFRVELDKMLLAEKPSLALKPLYQGRLDQPFLPLDDLILDSNFPLHHKDVFRHTLQVVDNSPPRLVVRMAALFHDMGKKATRSIVQGKVHFLGHEFVSARKAKESLRHLGYSNAFLEDVVFLVRHHLYLHGYGAEGQEWTDGAVRRFVRVMGDRLEDFFSLAAADITSANHRRVQNILARLASLKNRIQKLQEDEAIQSIKPLLDGNEIMTLFTIPPGPLVGEIKNRIFEKQLELGASYTKEDALADARAFALEKLKLKS